MRKLILAFTLCLFNINAFSTPSNPQIRVCNINGGEFWSYKVLAGDEIEQADEIGFCRFDEAIMGSISLIKFFHEDFKTQALAGYFKTRKTKVLSCEDLNALVVKSIDSLGEFKNLCVFPDRSYIGETTLLRGWNSVENLLLNSNLL